MHTEVSQKRSLTILRKATRWIFLSTEDRQNTPVLGSTVRRPHQSPVSSPRVNSLPVYGFECRVFSSAVRYQHSVVSRGPHPRPNTPRSAGHGSLATKFGLPTKFNRLRPRTTRQLGPARARSYAPTHRSEY